MAYRSLFITSQNTSRRHHFVRTCYEYAFQVIRPNYRQLCNMQTQTHSHGEGAGAAASRPNLLFFSSSKILLTPFLTAIPQWRSVSYRCPGRTAILPPQKSWDAWRPFITPIFAAFLPPLLIAAQGCPPTPPLVSTAHRYATTPPQLLAQFSYPQNCGWSRAVPMQMKATMCVVYARLMETRVQTTDNAVCALITWQTAVSTWPAVNWLIDIACSQVPDTFYFLTTSLTTPPQRHVAPPTETTLYSSVSGSSRPPTSPVGNVLNLIASLTVMFHK